MAVYGLNFGYFAFLSPVYLRLIGKLEVDFLFVLIELFSLAVMAEALGNWRF